MIRVRRGSASPERVPPIPVSARLPKPPPPSVPPLTLMPRVIREQPPESQFGLQGHINAAELEARLRETRAERDEAKDGFLSERRQVIELRQVLTEVFTCLDAKDIDLFDDDQVDEWRKRAGIEAGQ